MVIIQWPGSTTTVLCLISWSSTSSHQCVGVLSCRTVCFKPLLYVSWWPFECGRVPGRPGGDRNREGILRSLYSQYNIQILVKIIVMCEYFPVLLLVDHYTLRKRNWLYMMLQYQKRPFLCNSLSGTYWSSGLKVISMWKTVTYFKDCLGNTKHHHWLWLFLRKSKSLPSIKELITYCLVIMALLL